MRDRFRDWKYVWGTFIGALLGFVFGQINVAWATLFATETWRLAANGYRRLNPGPTPPPAYWEMVVRHPNVMLLLSVLFFAGVGFALVYSLEPPRPCSGCGKDNPARSKVCQFCGHRFLGVPPLTKMCPSCRRKFVMEASICPFCVTPLITDAELETMRQRRASDAVRECPKCKERNLLTRKQCRQCGHSFDEGSRGQDDAF